MPATYINNNIMNIKKCTLLTLKIKNISLCIIKILISSLFIFLSKRITI